MCTNCVTFFDFDNLQKLDDVIVCRKDDSYISVKDLLINKGQGYCDKEIREGHNISRMLISHKFLFKKISSFDENGIPLTRDKAVQHLFKLLEGVK